MVTKIIELKKPKFKNPILIEGLPGIGNVGRMAAGYLAEELKAKKFAEILSSHFMPFVLLHQSSAVHMLKNELYYWKSKKRNQRDLIILIGDSQSVSPEGHYEVIETILNYLEKFKVKEIFTLAGLGIKEQVEVPKVVGAVSDPELVKKYKKYGIDFNTGAKVGTIAGASGLLLGLGRYYKMKGVCLLGETSGFSLIPDPKSAEQILKILTKILNVKIDLSKLDKKVKEMEEFLKKVRTMESKELASLLRTKMKPPKEEKLTYIG
jgi:hypothetical protein